MKILVLLVAGILTACATTTLTEQETAVCKGNQNCLVAALADKVVQEEYELEDRRIQRKEKIVSYILACHYAGNVMFYKKRVGARIGSSLIDRYGVVHVPKHAHLIDFACVRLADARDILKDVGCDPRRGGCDRY
ncbi:MAG: hypothetical protein J3T61_05280 [Candidatus Brocadiales bacterium]|nr:hypothetical protein [Candidatus Bathyanammoxibius sp.]